MKKKISFRKWTISFCVAKVLQQLFERKRDSINAQEFSPSIRGFPKVYCWFFRVFFLVWSSGISKARDHLQPSAPGFFPIHPDLFYPFGFSAACAVIPLIKVIPSRSRVCRQILQWGLMLSMGLLSVSDDTRIWAGTEISHSADPGAASQFNCTREKEICSCRNVFCKVYIKNKQQTTR